MHRELLGNFLKGFWVYYDQLLVDHQKPRLEERLRLETGFDPLFTIQTGYEELGKWITKTRIKKESILLVLKYPQIPLHNNSAELGVRQHVRKRDVNFRLRIQDGVRAWDTISGI